MEQSKNASWHIYKEAITRRNVMFLLNVILWSFVLYFSIYDDGIDALLSCISVPLILFTFRRMRSVGDSFAYFLNLTSKVLILAAISLVIFSKFWNTAFYSVCLGILIQKVIYEMELEARNVNPDLREQASSEITKTDTSDEFKQLSPGESLKLRQVANEMHAQENEIKEFNMKEYYEFIGRGALNDDKESQSTQEKNEEIQSSNEKLNKPYPDYSEIKSDLDEIFSIEDFQRYFHEQFDECQNMFHEKNCKRSSDTSEESDECTLKLKLLNLHELSLRELVKIKSKLELDVADVERELKEKEVTDMDTSEHSGTLNVETLKVSFPEDDVKKLDVISNNVEFLYEPENKFEKELFYERINICSDAYSGHPRDFIQNNEISSKNLCQQNQNEIKRKQLETTSKSVESEAESENKLKKELFHMQVNTNSDIYKGNSHYVAQKNDLINSCGFKNSCQQNPNEIKLKVDLETLHPIINNADSTLLNKKSTCLDIDLRNQKSVEVNCTNSAIDQENGLMKSSLQEYSFETIEKFDSKTNYPSLKCESIETKDVQPEKETCDYDLKCVSVNDVNPEKDFEVLPESENCLESKGLSSSKISVFGDHSSKSNELANDAENGNLTKESVKKTSGDVGATLISCVSNVEDVVNRIDLGFIYAIGFNDPCVTNEF